VAGPERCVGFVFGGGGILGACEAGMVRALLEAGVVPDVIVGTSVGAINGVAVAAAPTAQTATELVEVWERLSSAGVFAESFIGRLARLVRAPTHLHSNEPLRRLLSERIPVDRIEDLAVRFECVAASIDRAAEQWFSSGPLVDAVLASAALPGVLPPVRIGEEHYLDGGLVNSIPINRAVTLGANVVYVLHVGRIEQRLQVPRLPWEVGFVAFEIARRHRFHTDLANLPAGVQVHVLPTGVPVARRRADLAQLRYWDTGRIGNRIHLAYRATVDYLAELEDRR
jgi:NTE family protein